MLLMLVSFLLLLLIALLVLLFGVFKKKFIRLKARILNYYMRLMRMFEKKKFTEKEVPIMQWVNAHLAEIEASVEDKPVEASVNALDRLARIFFKRVFLIRYAFTHEELLRELDNHKIPLVLKKATDLLFEEFAQINYGGEAIEKIGVKTIISQLRVITERLVYEIEARKKTKINISERDLSKISETLEGAHKLGIAPGPKK
jgi:hypothetical protein